MDASDSRILFLFLFLKLFWIPRRISVQLFHVLIIPPSLSQIFSESKEQDRFQNCHASCRSPTQLILNASLERRPFSRRIWDTFRFTLERTYINFFGGRIDNVEVMKYFSILKLSIRMRGKIHQNFLFH